MWGKEARLAVEFALEVGYRLIDTAAMYGNESEIGDSLLISNIPRRELFITTKVNNSDQGYDRTLRAYETSCKKLKLDEVDLYLIHCLYAKQGKKPGKL
jgi:diketogulonate reductase-like aldo/keto reductase